MPEAPKITHHNREVRALNKAGLSRELLCSDSHVTNLLRDGRLKPVSGRADESFCYYYVSDLQALRSSAIERLRLEASRLSAAEQLKLLGPGLAEIQTRLAEINEMFRQLSAKKK